MIGLLPVNSETVNGTGAAGVWHIASASAVCSAVQVAPETLKTKVVGKFTRTARALPTIATVNTKFTGASAIARAVVTKAGLPRNVVASMTALARAVKSKAGLSGTKFALAQPALARCFAAPIATLINANYLVAFANARCEVIAQANANVHMTFRNAYTVASATATRASLSGRKTMSSSAVASASATRAAGIRNRVLHAAAVVGAVAGIVSIVIKPIAATAVARVSQVLSTFAFIRFVGLIRPVVRAIAPPIQMVSWMFVHEPDYRTVYVRNDASTTRMRSFRKQPTEILPYDIDFAEWLTPGDDVESAEVHVDSAINGAVDDLVIGQVVLITSNPEATATIAATRLKVWLEGGVHGATYKITVRVDTEGGRRKEVDFRLNTREV